MASDQDVNARTSLPSLEQPVVVQLSARVYDGIGALVVRNKDDKSITEVGGGGEV